MSLSTTLPTAAICLAFAALCSPVSPCAAQETASAQEDTSWPPEGHNERYNQLVLDGNFAASGVGQTGTGGGAALRLGRVYPVGIVVFVPEIGADVFRF